MALPIAGAFGAVKSGSVADLWDRYFGRYGALNPYANPDPYAAFASAPVSGNVETGWILLGLMAVLGLAAWGLGRACRYVLAGE